MAATQRFASPGFAAFDVACTAARYACSDEETASMPQLVIPRRGAFVWRVGKRTMLAEPNTVLLFHPAYPYRVSHPAEGGDDCTSLHVDPEHVDDAVRPAFSGARYWILDGASAPALHLAVHAVRGHGDALAREEAVMTILRSIARAPEPQADRHARAVDGVRERLASQPGERATLAMLAQGAALSPYELARRFRARTGSSIHQYRLRLRLLLALSRLREGASDLTGLALDLGFASHAHFTAAFHAAFGVTPREARGWVRCGHALQTRIERSQNVRGGVPDRR